MTHLQQFIDLIEQELSYPVLGSHPISGGDINEAIHLETARGDYFLKYNHSNPEARAILKSEERNLEVIRDSGSIACVETIAYLEIGEAGGLLLPYIEQELPDEEFWILFGIQMADLHRNSKPYFGLEFNNFIGTIPQNNRMQSHWSDFYASCRILPVVRECYDAGLLDRKDIRSADALCNHLRELFPEENSSLLHGDLWSGNFLCTNQGKPMLIDPAVYYGHREMDIAMTTLFGGFSETFYQSYLNQFPLDDGWKNRLKYGQLYYLLIHLLLFGLSYQNQVQFILKKFQS